MKLSVASYTNIGSRSINEDYTVYREEDNNLLAVVCDGLGGHDKGEVASEHVGEYIKNNFDFNKSLTEELGRVMKGAQETLMKRQMEEKAVNAMKTTAVVLAIKGDKVRIGHVGDSRGYVFGRWNKHTRTLDHSVPQMLVLAGEIKEEDIRHHSERSSLLRVMGSAWDKDAYEVSDEIKLRKAKAFLLCTDGFWELIEENDMKRCLKESQTPGEWLEKMAEIVKKNGAGTDMDNFTATAVFVTKG